MDPICEVEYWFNGITFDQFLVDSEEQFTAVKPIKMVGEFRSKITYDQKRRSLFRIGLASDLGPRGTADVQGWF
jgi:hypothetical protein